MKYEYKKKNKDQIFCAKFWGILMMAGITILAYVGAYVFTNSDMSFTLYHTLFDFQKDMVKFFVPIIGIVFSIAIYIIGFNEVIKDETSINYLGDDKKKTLKYVWQRWAKRSILIGGLVSIIALLLCKAGVPFISPTFIVVWIVQAISVIGAFAFQGPLNKNKIENEN